MIVGGTIRMRVLLIAFAATYILVCYLAFFSLPEMNGTTTVSGRFNPRGPRLFGSTIDELSPKEVDTKLSDLRKRLNESLVELIELREDIKGGGLKHGEDTGALKELSDKLDQVLLQRNTFQSVSNAESDQETVKRQQFVKKMMEHAWSGYVKHAWGQSELRPDSLSGHNPGIFGGTALGASIVDSLDTLFIMDMREEFDRARKWVAESLDFGKLSTDVSVFEFTIRYLGGLLSAYALSKDEIFSKKAKEVADRLLPAFNTPTGLPFSLLNLQSGVGRNYGWASGGCSILAEVGTVQMEFGYMSKVTGDVSYGQKVRKAREVLTAQGKPGGLYPNYVNQNSGSWCNQDTSIGALGDSFYEYLLKDWIRTGRNDAGLRSAFDQAVEAIRSQLAQRSQSGFLYFAEKHNGQLQHKVDHLACFFAGTLALGAQHLQSADSRRDWLTAAAEFTHTCRESYARTATHIGPDSFRFSGGNEFTTERSNEKAYLMRPEVVESYFYLWRFTHNETYRDWAWDAAQAIERHCRAAAGYAGLHDVYAAQPSRDDVQQSYFLAETLKYLYLTFSPDSLLPLDKWVFNTEAHPLPVDNA